MAPFLFVVLSVFCVLELFVSALFGATVGAVWLAVLILVTAVIGFSLVNGKMQAVDPDNWFAEEDPLLTKIMITENALVAMSGLLLLVPGLVTDILGLFLLSPSARRTVAVIIIENNTRRQARSETAASRQFLSSPNGKNPFVDEKCRGENAEDLPEYDAQGNLTQGHVTPDPEPSELVKKNAPVQGPLDIVA